MDEKRDIATILGQSEFTQATITEMRKALTEAPLLYNDALFRSLSSRASIETLDSIRLLRASIVSFDKASADLINTTNKLTKWVLGLTILGVLLAGGSFWLSWLALQK